MKVAGPAGRGLVSPNLAARTANHRKGLMDEASHSFRIAKTLLASVGARRLHTKCDVLANSSATVLTTAGDSRGAAGTRGR